MRTTDWRLLQIVDGNRLLRGYINVLGDQKVPSQSSRVPRAAPSLARWIRIAGDRRRQDLQGDEPEHGGTLNNVEHAISPIKRIWPVWGPRYVVLSALKLSKQHLTGPAHQLGDHITHPALALGEDAPCGGADREEDGRKGARRVMRPPNAVPKDAAILDASRQRADARAIHLERKRTAPVE